MSAKLLVATGGETGVLSMIPSSNTAPGVDNIPNKLLKKGGDAIVGVLYKLFNIIWLREAPPTIWERALIRPLYKTGSKDPLLTENYRAIKLICTTCKLYESILYHESHRTWNPPVVYPPDKALGDTWDVKSWFIPWYRRRRPGNAP